MLELAASKAADSVAFDHVGMGSPGRKEQKKKQNYSLYAALF